MKNKLNLAKQILEGYSNLILDKAGLTSDELKELSSKRMNVCNECHHLSSIYTCNKCGCYMPAKTKTREATCPEKHW